MLKVEPIKSSYVDPTIEIARIAQQLKLQHSSELESSVPVWDRLKEPKDANMNIFTNQNIRFEDDEGPMKNEIANFEQIFENLMYKRIIICGRDGYGKSTMVREMVKQWVLGWDAAGPVQWVRRFSFVFYFRMELITSKQTKSLENLIESQQLSAQETKLICHWIRSKNKSQKVMMIFDGVHEFRQNFCDEVNDIILGIATHCPFVVLTTKQEDERLKEANFCLSIYLNGLKDHVIQQQILTARISGVVNSSFDLSLFHLLQVPFYYSLYLVTLHDSGSHNINVSTLLEKYLKLLGRRHRKSNPLFSDLQEQELLVLLGQISQAQFSLLDIQPNVQWVQLTPKYLNVAKSVGYIQQESTQDKIIFPHRAISEFFAAWYWVRKIPLQALDVPYLQMVEFVAPMHGLCTSIGLFSCILSNYNKSYKQYLWNRFTEYVPFLNDYNDMPIKLVDIKVLRFPDISGEATGKIMEQIVFDVHNPSSALMTFVGMKFEGGRKFSNLIKFRKFSLMYCHMKLTPSQFFTNYNLKELDLNECMFQEESFFDRRERRDARLNLQLQLLQVSSPTGAISNWLRYVMNESKSLQNLDLSDIGDIEDSWVLALRNNLTLLKSIQKISISFTKPVKIASLLQAITSMPNLTDLNMSGCYMTINEVENLAQYFDIGARKLKHLHLEDDENVGKTVRLWESLGRLNSLKELQITDCKLSNECLKVLQNIFRQKLPNLEKITFVKENVINNNSNILTMINMSRSLRQVVFDKCQMSDNELELAKTLMTNFKYDSQKVIRGGRMDTVLKFYK